MLIARTLARSAFVGSVAAGLALPLSLGAVASASDPKEHQFSLTCGGTTYQVWSNGNGEFTPARDAEGHVVFVPHWFGSFHGEVYDADGNLVDSFDEEGSEAQGSGKQKNDVSCTYTFDEVSDGSDPEFPAGFRFVGSGSVTGQQVGKR